MERIAHSSPLCSKENRKHNLENKRQSERLFHGKKTKRSDKETTSNPVVKQFTSSVGTATSERKQGLWPAICHTAYNITSSICNYVSYWLPSQNTIENQEPPSRRNSRHNIFLRIDKRRQIKKRKSDKQLHERTH